jgi:hypothetical protein
MTLAQKLLSINSQLMLQEDVSIITTKNNLGYTRDQLPQIDQDKLKEFLSYLSNDKDIQYESTMIKADELFPSQKEINVDKAQEMAKNMSWDDLVNSPIIVSNDMYVIDGHHRWLAVRIKKGEGVKPLKAIKINLPAHELIKCMNDWNGSYNKNITERLLSSLAKNVCISEM